MWGANRTIGLLGAGPGDGVCMLRGSLGPEEGACWTDTSKTSATRGENQFYKIRYFLSFMRQQILSLLFPKR